MIKIRKLISSCAVGCSCLWFLVSASAVMTLEAVLEEIGISEVNLTAAGLHEQAEEIIRSENERASCDVAHILELAPKALGDGATGLGFFGIRPLVTPDGIQGMIETSWGNAKERAKERILELLHGKK
jgi:hypothetical protein